MKRYRARREAGLVSAPPINVADIPDRLMYPKMIFKTHFGCGHQNLFSFPPPQIDEPHWCYRCVDYQLVVKVDQGSRRDTA